MKKISFYFLLFSFFFLLSACGAKKPAAQPVVKPGLTAAVVAGHSTSTDCWVIMNNNIYDITEYIPKFSGATSTLTAVCGKDATAELFTSWKNSPTGDADRQTFEQYYIGDLAR
jgi:cytochrome b involved in lipid metabolism